tara:strand:+ start:730 stop:1323 length:594 start_codon:yes stop_codon:yes gene_type:complete
MPNHCYNQVTIQSSQEDIDKIMEHLRGGETMFDFNNLVPMPEVIKDLQYVHANQRQYYYSVKKWRDGLNGEKEPYLSFPDVEWLEKNGVDDFTIRRLEIEHGTASWYDWCCSNWGTKWNAYDVEYDIGPIPNATSLSDGRQIKYTLTTAWAEPRPIISALMHYLSQPGFDQDLEMRWRFEDESENFNGEIRNGDDEV